MTNTCRFCAIAAGSDRAADYDRPFVETNSYFAIPSVGGFVEGWSLVCPRDHVYSLRTHYKFSSFWTFVRATAERITSFYGPVIAFEHGSSHAGSLTSCGTDHGHMHIVPLGFSLIDQLKKSDRSWTQSPASSLADLGSDVEYLFYLENMNTDDPVGFTHVLQTPVSQFFRGLIARQIQCEGQSDYRRFPFLNLASKTRNVLAG